MKHLNIIIPVYNEEGSIVLLVTSIHNVMKEIPYSYSLLFVDDGSSDNTLGNIKNLLPHDSTIHYISLSRNFGHQNALKAGLDKTNGDCVITMDGDLQHPPELIPLMLKKYEEGYDIVYTIRQDEKNLPFFKRKTAAFFYYFLNSISEVKVDKGSADFRLISNAVADILRSLTEYDLFFRGLVKWAGFKQISIEYRAALRSSGATKYTFHKMFRLALFGILSFSTRPLYLAVYLGFIFSLLSVLYLPYAIISYYFGYAISGWASIVVTIAFFGGIQLMVLGIIGLYVGRIFMQVKNRPAYIIKESNIL